MDLSKYVGNKIKELRERNNYTQDYLAELLNTTRQSVSRYENGDRKANQDVLFDLAEIFNVSINTFFPDSKINKKNITTIYNSLDTDRQTKVYNYAEYQLDEQNASTVNENVVSLDDYRNNVRMQSKVSAGTGILDLDPENAETISYTGKLPNYYDMAFQVSGNSMEPTFFDGDIIFVEKMNEVINGALMVVQIDDEAFIKKVYKNDQHLRLVSLNKEYKDIIADGNNDIRIVGKVVF
ncbi:MAG TPA: XRE family transcriptional regulator [Candidatus Tetragenococcus pullicola]|nr:XRE family transcriptional regulator [Candidatus Tetragenococcus pullicola]